MGLDRRKGLMIGGGIVAVLLALLVIAAAFPWGVLKGTIEARLSSRFGRPVTIASMRRADTFGFTPTLAVSGVRVPQADWAGHGDFATIGDAQATFSIWPLLTGRFSPQDVVIRGMRLNLVRAADGRDNWSRPGDARKGGNNAVALAGLTVADSVIDYRDAKQDRHVTAHFTADPHAGIRADGAGMVRGAAITLSLAGPPVEAAWNKPWPFTATIAGRDLAMRATGAMDHPLDTDHMTLDVTARASDLKLIDAVIEAGLFRSQPVRLAAHVRHDAPGWTISGFRGTIGRSRLAGSLTVAKADGRTKLTGDITATELAFEDFSSDEALARGKALERRIGLRLVPNARIDLSKIDTTDGTLTFRILHILGADGPSTLQSMRGTATLDHRVLTLSPFAIGLTRGTASGRIVADQGDRPVPIVTIDLALRGSDLPALVGGGGDFTGSIAGHARLKGRGETLRAAVGHSDGTIGLIARNGVLPAKIADALGFDAGRALFAGKDDRAGLRCAVVRLDVRDGRGRLDPMVVDTTQSQLNGTGTVTFPDEALSIRLTGAPKRNSLLRLPGSATMTGTIRAPHVTIPPEVKSVGNIFKAIGRAIKGTQGPTASDANCGALAARVMR